MKLLNEKKRGFTLIELLVVISIIAVLSTVIMGSLNDAREKARISAGEKFEAFHRHKSLSEGSWSFDNEDFTDLSGNNLNMSVSVGSPSFEEGYNSSGKALYLTNDSIGILASSVPDLRDAKYLYLSAWVKTTNNAHKRVLSYGHFGHSDGFVLQLTGGSGSAEIVGGVGNCSGVGSAIYYKSIGAKISDGKWHHIAMEFDFENNISRMFKDGNQIGDIAKSDGTGYVSDSEFIMSECNDTGSGLYNSAYRLCIGGGSYSCEEEIFTGLIDNPTILVDY